MFLRSSTALTAVSVAGAVAAQAFLAGSALAADAYWDGSDMAADNVVDGGNGTWNALDTNWTDAAGAANAAWVGNDTAIFQTVPGVVTVAGTQAIGGLTFNVNGYVLNGGTLDLAASTTVTTMAGAGATIGSTLIDTGSLTFAGGGYVVLNGVNTYSGATFINGGTVVAGNAAALGVASQLSVNGGNLNLGGVTIVENTVQLAAGQIFNGTLNANTSFSQSGGTFSGTTTTPVYAQSGGLMAGTVNATQYTQSGGSMAGTTNATTYSQSGGTMSGTANTTDYNQSGGSVTGGGVVNTTNYALSGGGAMAGTVNATTSIFLVDGTVSGTLNGAAQLTKGGAGTVTLSGANTYTGDTVVNNGVLTIAGAGTLGAVAGDTTVNGGTLGLGGTTQTQAMVTLNNGTIQNGTLDATTSFTQTGGTFSGMTTTPLYNQSGGTMSGTATADVYNQSGGAMNGTVNATTSYTQSGGNIGGTVATPTYTMTGGTVDAGGAVNASALFDLQTGTVNGTLSDGGDLQKNGAGTVLLAGTNTYGGTTTVNAGVLQVQNGSALPDTSAVTVNGGTLELLTSETIGSLAGAGTVAFNANNLTTGNLGDTTFSGMGTGTGTLIKQGASTFTLQGANLAGSMTVNAGSAILNGSTVGGSFSLNGGTAALNNSTVAGALGIGGATTATVNGISAAGSVANSGTISFVDGDRGDALNVGTNYLGTAGTVAVDLDFVSATSDRLTVGANAGGTTTVNFAVTGSGIVAPDILVVDVGTSTNNAFSGTIASAPLVDYVFQQNATGDWVVRSVFNQNSAGAALGNLSGALTSIVSGFHQPQGAFVVNSVEQIESERSAGLWLRMNGGRFNQTAGGSITSPSGPSAITVANSAHFVGAQVGADFGIEEINGSDLTLNFGVTGGIVSGGVSATNSPGAFIDFEAPFVGAYAVVEKGGFDADLNFRTDFYELEITNPALGVTALPVSGRGYNISSSASYTFDWNNLLITPQVGLSYTRTSIDSFMIPSGDTVSYSDYESLLGKIGIQFAGQVFLEKSQLALSPFINFSIWNEFNNSSVSTLTQGAQQFVATIEGVGTYGQVSVGVSGLHLPTNISAFFRADFRKGSNISGFVGNVGIRKTF